MKNKNNKYLVLLIDREHARIFSMIEGRIANKEIKIANTVPQKVKHGDDTWDAQDKIFRHIEVHLRNHLKQVGKEAWDYAKQNKAYNIIIGSHKPLFRKVLSNLPSPLARRVKGKFVTELKAPLGEILQRADKLILQLEKKASYG